MAPNKEPTTSKPEVMEVVTYKAVKTIFGIVSAAISVVVWAFLNFQTKAEADSVRMNLERRVDRVEAENEMLRTSLTTILGDVSYIRGRLEPKSK